MTDKEPTPFNGLPFYCALCGCGYGEFLACEQPDCRLEDQQKARARARKMRWAGKGPTA